MSVSIEHTNRRTVAPTRARRRRYASAVGEEAFIVLLQEGWAPTLPVRLERVNKATALTYAPLSFWSWADGGRAARERAGRLAVDGAVAAGLVARIAMPPAPAPDDDFSGARAELAATRACDAVVVMIKFAAEDRCDILPLFGAKVLQALCETFRRAAAAALEASGPSTLLAVRASDAISEFFRTLDAAEIRHAICKKVVEFGLLASLEAILRAPTASSGLLSAALDTLGLAFYCAAPGDKAACASASLVEAIVAFLPRCTSTRFDDCSEVCWAVGALSFLLVDPQNEPTMVPPGAARDAFLAPATVAAYVDLVKRGHGLRFGQCLKTLAQTPEVAAALATPAMAAALAEVIGFSGEALDAYTRRTHLRDFDAMGFRMSTVHSGSFAEDMQVEFTADRTCAEVLVKLVKAGAFAGDPGPLLPAVASATAMLRSTLGPTAAWGPLTYERRQMAMVLLGELAPWHARAVVDDGALDAVVRVAEQLKLPGSTATSKCLLWLSRGVMHCLSRLIDVGGPQVADRVRDRMRASRARGVDADLARLTKRSYLWFWGASSDVSSFRHMSFPVFELLPKESFVAAVYPLFEDASFPTDAFLGLADASALPPAPLAPPHPPGFAMPPHGGLD
jgi:hypothetical protein